MKRFICFLISALMICAVFVPCVTATESSNTTAVKDDLLQFGFTQSQLMNDYPLDETITADDRENFLSLMYVLEFGYDWRQVFADYGLYLYVYNPSGTSVSLMSGNSVQLSVSDEYGEFGTVTKYPLLLLSSSEDYRFLKFRVNGLNSSRLCQMKKNERKYRFSGIEVKFFGEQNPSDFEVSGIYTFTGFMHGYGADLDANSSLHFSYDKYETIHLDLHPVSYLAGAASDLHRDEISGVYFAVPNFYLKKYGTLGTASEDPTKGLYKVAGEWYEYKVNGIVTDDYSTWNYIQNYTHTYIPVEGDHSIPFSFISFSGVDVSRPNPRPHISFNHEFDYDVNSVSVLNNVFYANSWESISSSDFTSVALNFSVPPTDLDVLALRKDVFGPVPPGYVYPIQKYFADSGRFAGKNTFEVTSGDLQFITDYIPWNGWLGNFFGNRSVQSIPALEAVTSDISTVMENFIFNDSALSEKYHINAGDVSDFCGFVTDNLFDGTQLFSGAIGSTGYILRFAVTDFYSETVSAFNKFDGYHALFNHGTLPGNYYYFEKTVFKDFDILSLTFKDEDGGMVTFAVNADPTDVGGELPSVHDVTGGGRGSAPKESFFDFFGKLDTWAKILVVVLGLLVISFVLRLGGSLFGPALGLIGSGFKFVFSIPGKLWRGIFGNRSASDVADQRYQRKRRKVTDEQKDEDRTYDRERQKKYDAQHDADRILDRRRQIDLDEQREKDRKYDRKRQKKYDAQRDEDRASHSAWLAKREREHDEDRRVKAYQVRIADEAEARRQAELYRGLAERKAAREAFANEEKKIKDQTKGN